MKLDPDESPYCPFPFPTTRFRLASGSGNVALHFSMSALIILDFQLCHDHHCSGQLLGRQYHKRKCQKRRKRNKKVEKEMLQMEKQCDKA